MIKNLVFLKPFFREDTKLDAITDGIKFEIYRELSPFRFPILLVHMTAVAGTLGYVLIDDFTISDALFQTFITFTTTGFGEIQKMSEAGRLFTDMLMLVGFACLTLSIGIIIEVLNKGKLIPLLKELKMIKKITTLRNHYVICYYNEYTDQVAKQFIQDHIPFIIIDPDPNFESVAKHNRYVYYLIGDPYSEESFIKANIASAKGVVALSNKISDNISLITMVRLIEKDLNRSACNIISMATDSSFAVKLKKMGADFVIYPSKIIAEKIGAMAIRPDMVNVLEPLLYKKGSPMHLEQIEVRGYSWLCGEKVGEIRFREKFGISLVGMSNKDGSFISVPSNHEIIKEGSRLILIGSASNIEDAVTMFKTTKSNKY